MLSRYADGHFGSLPVVKNHTLKLNACSIRVQDFHSFERANEEGDFYFGATMSPCSNEYLASVQNRPTPDNLELNRDAPPVPPPEPDLSKIPEEYKEFRKAFVKSSQELPAHGPHDLGIDIEPGKTPPFGPLYSLSGDELKLVHDYLVDMLAKGLIRVSNAPCGAPILFARKKDGSLRLCVDYRRLNNITIKNVYPLPLIHELLDRVSGSAIFSKLDLTNAYWHIRIKEGDEWKTAFRTRYGLFEYLVMPFGLSNAPSTFQAHVNQCFSDMLDVFLVIYLDDLLIYSKNKEEHIRHVRAVLQRLIDKELSCNPKKCAFHTDSVEFLGYIISKDGVSMCPERVEAIRNWVAPTNVSELRSFLGFCNFYRGFIKDYSPITTPLTSLFKKDTAWRWSAAEQASFDLLKNAFLDATIVRHFDPTLPVTLETDASDFAISGVISQQFSDGLRPIGFYSRKLRDAELNYDTHDKELLAVIECVKAWRHWLQGSTPFTIITDHHNLQYFMSTKQLNRRQVRWSHVLTDYNFTLVHRSGSLNGKADALSRRAQDALDMGDTQQQSKCLLPPDLFHKISAIYPQEPYKDFEKRIKQALPRDQFYQDARLWLQDPEKHAKPFKFRVSKQNPTDAESNKPNFGKLRIGTSGLLYYDNTLYVPQELRLSVLVSRHDSPLAGHFGLAKTLELITRDYWWPQISHEVAEYIKTCEVCSRSKSKRRKPSGLLHPLPTPTDRWVDVSMDFMSGLPNVDGYDNICVVVDRFTKMAHFIPCKKAIDAKETAKLFIANVVKLHGLPRSILSDRGPQFESKFWDKFWKHLRVTPTLSSGYHPETDGQTERVNSIVAQYLRAYVTYQQDDWVDLLPIAEFVYNNTKHSATGVTPFYANTARHPAFDPHTPATSATDENTELAEHMATLREFLTEQIEAARLEMAKYADVHRIPAPKYAPGDRVYLNAKNVRVLQPSKKLSPKSLGPFTVEKAIGQDAYRLLLPNTMKIHPVFHTSLLSPAPTSKMPGRIQPPPEPVTTVDEDEEIFEVEQILDSRYSKKKGGKAEYFIRWRGYDTTYDSWEPIDEIKDSARLAWAKYHDHYPDKPGPEPRPKEAAAKKSKAKK